MTTAVTPARSRTAYRSIRTDLEPIQLHAQAENALSVALFYLRQPVRNIPGATRKAVQALAALGRLHDLGAVGVPTSIAGRGQA